MPLLFILKVWSTLTDLLTRDVITAHWPNWVNNLTVKLCISDKTAQYKTLPKLKALLLTYQQWEDDVPRLCLRHNCCIQWRHQKACSWQQTDMYHQQTVVRLSPVDLMWVEVTWPAVICHFDDHVHSGHVHSSGQCQLTTGTVDTEPRHVLWLTGTLNTIYPPSVDWNESRTMNNIALAWWVNYSQQSLHRQTVLLKPSPVLSTEGWLG